MESVFVKSSHRGTFEGDVASVVEEPVEDGVATDVVPGVDGDLAGEQRAAAGVAVVEPFEQIVSSLA